MKGIVAQRSVRVLRPRLHHNEFDAVIAKEETRERVEPRVHSRGHKSTVLCRELNVLGCVANKLSIPPRISLNVHSDGLTLEFLTPIGVALAPAKAPRDRPPTKRELVVSSSAKLYTAARAENQQEEGRKAAHLVKKTPRGVNKCLLLTYQLQSSCEVFSPLL